MKKKIIFISYHFYPNKEVGANRTRFWINDLDKSSDDFEPVVITATPFAEAERLKKEQYYVAPTGITPVSLLIKDEGIKWRSPLIDFFESHQFTDVYGIIMTGGPYMHFSITPRIKQILNCPVLLDYRDPFANNPRFHGQQIKAWIKRHFERQFVKNADVITSVNSDCLGLLTGFESEKDKFHVIPNGFDEETFKTVKADLTETPPDDKYVMIYPGKYYKNASPNATFIAIKELIAEDHVIKFVHYGGRESLSVLENDSFIEEHGIVDYTEIVKGLLTAHIGIIYTEGDAFESSTKVFDYIGAEIPIIVITNGILYTGNIHRITADYPLIKWCKNNKDDIKQVMLELFKTDLNIKYPERSNFSRVKGLEKLLNTLRL